MYYEESIINGTMHFRLEPSGEWREVSKQSMTRTIVFLEARVKSLNESLERFEL